MGSIMKMKFEEIKILKSKLKIWSKKVRLKTKKYIRKKTKN